MLENECHHLDLKIEGKMAIKNHELEKKDFNYLVQNNRKICQLEVKISVTENKI